MSKVMRPIQPFHQNDYDNTEDLEVTVAADVLAIPVTHLYVEKTTGGDAEALTLADGQPGQFLMINLTTDGGGTGTLTPTTTTGFSTIAFDEAIDQAVLFYVDDSTGWIVWSATGAAGPPVIA